MTPLWACLRGAQKVDGSRIVGLLTKDSYAITWRAKWHLCHELLWRIARRYKILCVDAPDLVQKIGRRYASDFQRHWYLPHGVGYLIADSNEVVKFYGMPGMNGAIEAKISASKRDEEIRKSTKIKMLCSMPTDLREAWILSNELKGILNAKARIR